MFRKPKSAYIPTIPMEHVINMLQLEDDHDMLYAMLTERCEWMKKQKKFIKLTFHHKEINDEICNWYETSENDLTNLSYDESIIQLINIIKTANNKISSFFK